ncbi:hypothetical protein GCM10009758_07780 [Microbacterium hatanonis]
MYTIAGAELSGESHAKGSIEVGKYADLVILSADYFSVADDEIPHIEAELTVVGGRVVFASDAYEGQADPLESPSTGWSPVVHFGGYHRTTSGLTRARRFVDASADSAEQREWREQRGETIARHSHDPLTAHDH